jgi:hypothetical protein
MGNVGCRRLLQRPRFNLLSAAGTPAATGVIALDHHLGGNDVFHHTLMIFQIQQAGAAVRAGFAALLVLGQRNLLVSINMIRHRTQRRGMTLLASRFPAPPANHRRFDPIGQALVLLFPRHFSRFGGRKKFPILLQ